MPAYVEGRPIPCVSSHLMRCAAVYRGVVANDPIHDPAGLLGLGAGHVDSPRRLEGPLHRALGDGVERDPLGLGWIHPEYLPVALIT